MKSSVILALLVSVSSASWWFGRSKTTEVEGSLSQVSQEEDLTSEIGDINAREMTDLFGSEPTPQTKEEVTTVDTTSTVSQAPKRSFWWFGGADSTAASASGVPEISESVAKTEETAPVATAANDDEDSSSLEMPSLFETTEEKPVETSSPVVVASASSSWWPWTGRSAHTAPKVEVEPKTEVKLAVTESTVTAANTDAGGDNDRDSYDISASEMSALFGPDDTEAPKKSSFWPFW